MLNLMTIRNPQNWDPATEIPIAAPLECETPHRADSRSKAPARTPTIARASARP